MKPSASAGGQRQESNNHRNRHEIKLVLVPWHVLQESARAINCLIFAWGFVQPCGTRGGVLAVSDVAWVRCGEWMPSMGKHFLFKKYVWGEKSESSLEKPGSAFGTEVWKEEESACSQDQVGQQEDEAAQGRAGERIPGLKGSDYPEPWAPGSNLSAQPRKGRVPQTCCSHTT